MSSELMGTIRLRGSRDLHVFTDALVFAHATGRTAAAAGRRIWSLAARGAAATATETRDPWADTTAAAMVAAHRTNKMLHVDDIESATVAYFPLWPMRMLSMVLGDHTDSSAEWSAIYNRDDVVRPLLLSVLGQKLTWRA